MQTCSAYNGQMWRLGRRLYASAFRAGLLCTNRTIMPAWGGEGYKSGFSIGSSHSKSFISVPRALWPFGTQKEVYSPELRASILTLISSEPSDPAFDQMRFDRRTVIAIEEGLGYSFIDERLLCAAFWHLSTGGTWFSRLAFLGDSVLKMGVTEILMVQPQARSMGELNNDRSYLESRKSCSRMAGTLGLDKHIVLGKSFLGVAVPADGNVTAELFEAVLGAVYVDGGYEAARKVLKKSLPI
eukprot:jgi/Botrbrau1/4234/Bobra.0044s0029.1